MSDTIKLNLCPKCGAPIAPGAPQGLCPKCVLMAAATEAELEPKFLETADGPSIERVSAAFPNLEIIELIGRGGMGFVFKARQPNLDRFVALKLLPDELAKDPRFAERFNREGRVLARLNHPNIVSVYDFGKTEQFYFLLMEFVDGVNLRQAMEAGRFSPTEALRVVPEICEALQYAHEQGILHRDIKPANILLDTRGHVKIADFGIAKLVGDQKPDVTLTGTGAALGTPHYMAPEQLENPSEVDHRADIYSLGVVFYEMLTGELPIGRFAAPSSKTPVGEKVDEIVFRTLEKDREKRYQSAGEMKTQVQHLEPGQDVGVGVPADTEPRRLSTKALYGAVLVALSLPVPLLLIVALLLRVGRIGPIELLLTLFSLCVLGVSGTLLGWRGLQEIRQGAGRVTGLPLALFATLTWPLGTLVGLVVGVPMSFLSMTPPGQHTFGARISYSLVLLLPAAAITFAIWSILACLGWARRQPVVRRKGVLAGVFVGCLLVGFGAQMASHTSERPAMSPVPENSAVPSTANPAAAPAGPQPIRVNFRAAKGQVVTLELLWRENDTVKTVPNFAAFAVAPDDERARFSLELTPEPALSTNTNRLAWRVGMTTEDGAKVGGGVLDLGELISNLPVAYVHPIEADSSVELMLTRPSATADTNEIAQPVLGLSIVSRARGQTGGPQAYTKVSVGSTNWVQVLQAESLVPPSAKARPGEVLAHQWLKSSAPTNSTNNIRFTFTNVELREEAGRQWMAIDYAADPHGDCEEVFRMDGDDLVTRKESLLVTPEDSAPVLRQRFQWRIPEKVNRTVMTQLADAFQKALVGKSSVIPEGEQRPLLRFPVGDTGFVSVGIGARLRDPAASK